jgi:hypothetical protein
VILTVVNNYFCIAHTLTSANLGVAACAVLYHGPALTQPPKHGKRPVHDDFLKLRIAGRHSLRLHYGGRYFGRRERPWCGSQSILRKPGQLIASENTGCGDKTAWAEVECPCRCTIVSVVRVFGTGSGLK